MGLGRKIAEVNCHFHHAITICYLHWFITGDGDHDHLSPGLDGLSGLYTGTVTLFSPFSMPSPCLRGKELNSTSWSEQYVHGLFGILHRKFIFLPPFIYLFIYAIIYFCVDARIFYTLHYNPIRLIFCSNCSSLAIGVLSGGPCVLLTCPSPRIIVGFYLGTPFLSGTVRCSRFLWYIPCPSPWSSHLSKVA